MQRRTGGRSLGAVLFTDIVGSTAIAAEMGNTSLEATTVPIGAEVLGVAVDGDTGSTWVYLGKAIPSGDA